VLPLGVSVRLLLAEVKVRLGLLLGLGFFFYI